MQRSLAALAAASCIGFVAPGPASAQPGQAEIENLVVTGSRVPGPAAAAPASVTVLDQAAIEARLDASVLDLLSDVPGVYVNSPGGRPGVGSVFLRGGEANFTTVLIDGVQVNDPTNTRGGSFDFATLNLDDIERIEIVKGPQSSVYGSDALSGVINVITHSGTADRSATVNAGAGQDGYARTGFAIGGPVLDDSRYDVRFGSLTDEARGGSGSYRGQSLTGKLTLARTAATGASIYARHAEAKSRSFPESSGGPELAELRERDHRSNTDDTFGFKLRSELRDRLQLNVNAGHFGHRGKTRSPGVAPGLLNGIPPSETDDEFARDTVNVFLSSDLGARTDAVLGWGYENEDGSSAGVLMLAPQLAVPTNYALSRDDRAVYGELAYGAGRGFGLSAGLRTDDTAAGRKTTGRLRLAYAFPERPARLSLSWAQGFKLPSLFALGHPLVGNPDLRPETVESWQLAFGGTLRKGSWSWQAALFDQRFRDLIDFDFDTFRSVNRSRVDVTGLEAEARFDLRERWTLRVHGTYADADVLESDVRLHQRPKREGGISILGPIAGSLTLYADWRYVGARYDSSIPTGERKLAGYDQLDLALTWRYPKFRLGFALDNALGARYEEAIGFPALGRRARVSIEREFRLPR